MQERSVASSRRRSVVSQAEITRALKAARAFGMDVVEFGVSPSGEIRVRGPRAEQDVSDEIARHFTRKGA